MIHRLALLCALLLALSTAPAFAGQADGGASDEKDAGPLRILFVGNSYTSFNDLPAMISELAAAGEQRRVVTGSALRGGWTLQKHLEHSSSTTLELIEKGNWHIVVMQEQSQMPFMYPKATHKYGVKLGEHIKQHNAQPMLYMTWARLNEPTNQKTIATTYRGLADALDAPCAPVGLAWRQSLKQWPTLALHARDKSHPNPAGTYLAACVFYATLFGESPVGLPSRLPLEKNRRALVKLNDQTAKWLQETAWQVVQEEKKRKAKVEAEENVEH